MVCYTQMTIASYTVSPAEIQYRAYEAIVGLRVHACGAKLLLMTIFAACPMNCISLFLSLIQ